MKTLSIADRLSNTKKEMATKFMNQFPTVTFSLITQGTTAKDSYLEMTWENVEITQEVKAIIDTLADKEIFIHCKGTIIDKAHMKVVEQKALEMGIKKTRYVDGCRFGGYVKGKRVMETVYKEKYEDWELVKANRALWEANKPRLIANFVLNLNNFKLEMSV